MNKSFKNQKGITLIALVITIIVLLILAGVSISMISSQDGILNKATRAKEATKNATYEEKVRLAVQESMINENGTIDYEILNKNLELTEENKIEKLPATVTNKEGISYRIGKSGNVINSENVTKIEKNKSYVGYYADVDGDGKVDGIIYGDKAIGTEGTRKWKME